MAAIRVESRVAQPLSFDRGHPMPRRSLPQNSVTLRHHRLTDDLSVKADLRTPQVSITTSAPRRDSSGESHATGNSDPKKWFDRSNYNPTAFNDTTSPDVDPPFFQRNTDMSMANSHEQASLPLRRPTFAFVEEDRAMALLRPSNTHSSSADDYRSVIDDLTIENKRLKEELKRYKQTSLGMMKREKLFEIKVHGLPKGKKRELETTLRDFAASLEGSSDATSQRGKSAKNASNRYAQPTAPVSKHASSSSSASRPTDSAYASMSTAASSSAPNKSTASFAQRGPPPPPTRSKSLLSDCHSVEHMHGTPDGLFPRHLVMTDKDRKTLVVRRLEQLFTGKINGRNLHRNQSMSSLEPSASTPFAPIDSLDMPEASREARIQPHSLSQMRSHSRDNMSISACGDQAEFGDNDVEEGNYSGSGSPSVDNTSPSTVSPQEQRATRPHDLDPDRLQIPSENRDYIRHLGLASPGFSGLNVLHDDTVLADPDGWVYLNLLGNMAQLHMVNVTPAFIRSAVSEKSAKFQLSKDGHKLRWLGGTDGTKFSGDSSGDNSLRSPSTDSTDGSNDGGQRKKLKSHDSGDCTTSAPSSKLSKPGFATSAAGDFHYKPKFVRQSSSTNTSQDDTGSQASFGEVDESNLGGNSRWNQSGSGSSQQRKRRRDGAIIYYSGAPFCTDLSGDPGDVSPATYLSSSDALIGGQVLRPGLQRSFSGSSVMVRPLSDGRLALNESMDLNADVSRDLYMDDESFTDNAAIEFPWCNEPQKIQPNMIEPSLDACGLGGVVPEDHFAVVVTTKRPVLKDLSIIIQSQASRAKSVDTTESIVGNLASMTTSSPRSPRPVNNDSKLEIEYLSGHIRRFKPSRLPPPATFLPPFSDSSDEDDLSDSDEEDDSDDSDNATSSESAV